MESDFHGNMHIYAHLRIVFYYRQSFSNSVQRFKYGQSSKFKVAKISKKIMKSNFPAWEHANYILCPDTPNTYIVSQNSVQWFKRSCAEQLFIT